MILYNVNQHHLKFQKKLNFKEIILKNEKISKFSRHFQNLRKIIFLEELKGDSYWFEIIKFLYEAQNLYLKYPLPSNFFQSYNKESFENLLSVYKNVSDVHPECANEINEIFELLNFSLNTDENIYLKEINHLLATNPIDSNYVLYLKSGSLYNNFVDIYKNSIDKRITVVNEANYRKLNLDFDYLLVLGCLNFYEARDFIEPKFKNLICFRHNFLPTPNFEKFNFKNPVWSRSLLEFKTNNAIEKKQIFIPVEEEIDKESEFIINYYTQNLSTGNNEDNENLREANFCKLSGNYICFLCNHKGIDSTQEVLQIFEDSSIKITKQEIDDMSPGDFVILRVGKSDHELIELKTEEILKEKYVFLNNRKNLWKTNLQKYINFNTREILKKNMKNIGLNPSDANLRNWLSQDNQRLKHDNDFIKLLQLIGFDQKVSKEISSEMKSLIIAKQKAGRQVNAELKKRIFKDDNGIEEILNKGYEIYNFEGYNHSIGVFQIEYIKKDKLLKSSSSLDEAIKV